MLAGLPGVMSCGETDYFIRLFGQFDRWLREDPAAPRKWHKRLLLAQAQDASQPAGLASTRLRGCRGHAPGCVDASAVAATSANSAVCWTMPPGNRVAPAGWRRPPTTCLCRRARRTDPAGAHFLHVVRRGEDVLASAIDGQMRYAEHDVFDGTHAALGVALESRGAVAHAPCRRSRPYGASLRMPVHGATARCAAPARAGGHRRRLPPAPGDHRSHIADLGEEPWKHGSTDGVLRTAKQQVRADVRPAMRACWISARLIDYAAGRRRHRRSAAGAAVDRQRRAIPSRTQHSTRPCDA